jgi:hypothetical protein
MRDLEFFERQADYENHIWETVFTEPWVHETPFYRNLVNFIIDHRTPIFYTVSDAAEHFAFSGAYYFETRRQRYPNKTREQLFWLHDFTHMLFPYAHDVYETPERLFLEEFWYQERIASSETEVMAYYRVPGLREMVFPDEKLWYDVIRERGWAEPHPGAKNRIPISGDTKPDAEKFRQYRIRVQMDDEFGEQELGDYQEILAFVEKWRWLTPRWISKRYKSVAGMRIETPQYDRNFWAWDYETRIASYDQDRRIPAAIRQDNYERNIMANVRMAYDLLQWKGKPERWRHIPEAIDRLEGAVLLK